MHYMSMKQQSKMIMGHLRVWHLMLMVVYKLQPMCLFTKKVKHEEIFTYTHPFFFFFFFMFFDETEIIDIRRNSPTVIKQKKTLTKQKSKEEYLNMNEPLSISPPLSPLLTSNQNEKEEENNAKRFMDKFRNDRSSKFLESKVLFSKKIKILIKFNFLKRLAKSS